MVHENIRSKERTSKESRFSLKILRFIFMIYIRGTFDKGITVRKPILLGCLITVGNLLSSAHLMGYVLKCLMLEWIVLIKLRLSFRWLVKIGIWLKTGFDLVLELEGEVRSEERSEHV